MGYEPIFSTDSFSHQQNRNKVDWVQYKVYTDMYFSKHCKNHLKEKKTMLIIQVTMWPYKTTEEKTHSNKSALGEPFKLQAFKYYTWVQYEIKLKAAGCLIQHRLPLVCHKNMLWLYNILGIAHMVNSAYEDGSQCKSFELMLMKCCLNSKHSYAKWNETLNFPSPPPF